MIKFTSENKRKMENIDMKHLLNISRATPEEVAKAKRLERERNKKEK